MNSLWTVTYGNYELSVDRRTRTYRLVETRTGTVWGDGHSLGWMDLKDRVTGEVSRHGFGTMKVYSVSEKAGAQGKRILFGLDCEGIPLDIYLICSEREIQMVVESNRDSATHTVEGFCLLPGLCAITPDTRSHLVLPYGEGGIVFGGSPVDEKLGVWDFEMGLSMPFVGGIRVSDSARSALCLITDSAYAYAGIYALDEKKVEVSFYYVADPERRRLDLRILCLPDGDHISVARTYREKIISDRNHVTIRQKAIRHPAINRVLGAVWVNVPTQDLSRHPLSHEAQKQLLERWQSESKCEFTAVLNDDQREHDLPSLLVNRESSGSDDVGDAPIRIYFDGYFGTALYEPTYAESFWQEMNDRIETLNEQKVRNAIVGCYDGPDWVCNVADFLVDLLHDCERTIPVISDYWRLEERLSLTFVPLYSVVYHDVILYMQEGNPFFPRNLLRLLLHLSPPDLKNIILAETITEPVEKVGALLCPLSKLTVTAFLTAHRFLTNDYTVEEAVYSDRTRVVINQSETDVYETEEFALPPGGFYVRHSQMLAHDALRVGDEAFPTRAWRVWRARDGNSLETSRDVAYQEFPDTSLL